MSEIHVPSTQPFRWSAVEVRRYKEEGDHFRDITRQLLVDDPGDLGCQLRYFEIEPNGHSSLERHRHVHAVLVLRGSGRAIVGDRLLDLRPHDLVRVPPETWHQFLAGTEDSLGFLCLVRCDRDRPIRPTAGELDRLRAHPVVGPLLRAG